MAFNRGSSSRSSSVSTSEQARALLLPQEVKEIGIDSALIFYENVRPIRCSKIRYYAERSFRKRLYPPPARPVRRSGPSRDLPSDAIDASQDAPPLGDGLEPANPPPLTAEASLEALERLDSLTLEDFGDGIKNFKFQHAGEHPTDSELDADVQRFLAAVR
jgi:type IV secretion system protein VirD4